MTDIVWPWSMEKFAGSSGDRRSVLHNLAIRGFNVKKLRTNPPPENDRMVAAATKLLSMLMKTKEKGKVPWIVALCPSLKAMQAIAQLIPVGYSLTTCKSSCVIDNTTFMEIADYRNERDAELTEVERSGCLIWQNIDTKVYGSGNLEGRLQSILLSRIKHNRITLFTASMQHANKDHLMARFFQRIEKVYGPSIAASLNEAKFLNVKLKIATPTAETFDI